MSDARALDPAAGNGGREPPLVVDMDGTLLCTDSLYESFVCVLRRQPLALLGLPGWLRDGKASLKRELASRAELDVANLPYRRELLEHLGGERGRRALVLCSAADVRIASAVAASAHLFDEVIATDGAVNLSAERKAQALVDRFGERGFDYAGNARADLPVFARARRAIVVAPTFSLRRRLGVIGNLERTIGPRAGGTLAPYWRALRPHQWAKNLLVFVPSLATLGLTNASALMLAALAFVAFSFVASSVYLLNDLLDLGADRRHPRKCRRPLAAGTLPIAHALAMIPLLFAAGIAVSALLPPLFVVLVAVYWAVTLLYSFWLKRVPILDTLILAGLYTMRILAGAAAIAVTPSVWLLAFSMFFFMSLALAKRHSELVELESTVQRGTIPGREYRPEDLQTLISQGSASGYAAVLVLALFIDNARVHEHYRHPEIIWLICPLLLYWINKLWLNSQRRELDDDPVIWALTNRVSRAIALLSIVLWMLARWLP